MVLIYNHFNTIFLFVRLLIQILTFHFKYQLHRGTHWFDSLFTESIHLGFGWDNHHFPFLAYRVLCQQIWKGKYQDTDGNFQ